MRDDPDWSLSDCEPRRDPTPHAAVAWEAVLTVLVSLGLIAYLAGMVWVVWFNGD